VICKDCIILLLLLQGLIMLEAGTNRVVILANRVSASSPLYPYEPLMYTNDLDIGPDGTIYFTDSVNVHPHCNAQHNGNVTHTLSILGKPGFYDTVKGWGYGFLQVRMGPQAVLLSLLWPYDFLQAICIRLRLLGVQAPQAEHDRMPQLL
jgi:hypothetical protein